MRRVVHTFSLLMLLAGCQALTKKHDNPVMQAPPRRVSMDDSQVEQRLAEATKEGTTSAVQLASDTTESGDDTLVFNASVIATVNGAPIFAGDVLDRYGDYLRIARTKLPPEDYAKLREAIIQRDLRGNIERRLLVERMRSGLKPDQAKQFEQHIDKLFETEVAKLKGELKALSRTELELALAQRDSSLSAVREAFATNRMAMEYLASKVERPPAPTRPELVEYYQAHLDDYAVPARVKWQQIVSSWDGRTTRAEARAKITQAQQELQRGVAFEAVAKKFSDGPTAAEGGHWDWTQTGSLAESKLEAMLFAEPVGKVSDVWEGKTGYHLIRVIDRQTEGRQPFAEVQDAISEKLQIEAQKNLPQNFVKKLFDEAVIETQYKLEE
ncbi:MAG: peptidylprolyl isomerase [Planctomycetaceae bacterium]|nr:peptidylprolyl isomerase [Planctomycetaceae bacterium]